MKAIFYRNIITRAKNKRGFTLVEVVVVIAVLGILAVTAIPKAPGIIDSAKKETDKANLRTLNNATMIYSVSKDGKNTDVFQGISSDSERMKALVDNSYLCQSILAQQKDAHFSWDVASQIWKLTDGNNGSGNGGNNGGNNNGSGNGGNNNPNPQYPAWDPTKAYIHPPAVYVTYHGSVFYNQWYASPNIVPGTNDVWQEVTDQWRYHNYYKTNDLVLYKGGQFIARYNTNGLEPGDLNNNAWQEITDQWRNFNTYTLGDLVIYEGKQFRARDYTRNEIPGDLNNNKWQEITDQWRNFNTYTSGDLVIYEGKQFRARYYTRNQIPGDLNNEAWQEITDQWRNFNIYVENDRVWYKGKQYRAKWYTRNQEPGSADGPWELFN